MRNLDDFLDTYYAMRPQITPPPKTALGYEIPHNLKEPMIHLLNEIKKAKCAEESQ